MSKDGQNYKKKTDIAIMKRREHTYRDSSRQWAA
jgi:hypothetical protein